MGSRSDDDDGFGDFLSEDEEECALQAQEMAALERRMKTEGIRDGIEFGKEHTLQRGFDEGFAAAATASSRFGALRGALSAAKALGMLEQLEKADEHACEAIIVRLRELEVRCALPLESEANSASDTETVVAQARGLLEKLQLCDPLLTESSVAVTAASSSSGSL